MIDRFSDWILDHKRFIRLVIVCYVILALAIILYLIVGSVIIVQLGAVPGFILFLAGWNMWARKNVDKMYEQMAQMGMMM